MNTYQTNDILSSLANINMLTHAKMVNMKKLLSM